MAEKKCTLGHMEIADVEMLLHIFDGLSADRLYTFRFKSRFTAFHKRLKDKIYWLKAGRPQGDYSSRLDSLENRVAELESVINLHFTP